MISNPGLGVVGGGGVGGGVVISPTKIKGIGIVKRDILIFYRKLHSAMMMFYQLNRIYSCL